MEAEEATVFCQIETWDTGDTISKSDTSSTSLVPKSDTSRKK